MATAARKSPARGAAAALAFLALALSGGIARAQTVAVAQGKLHGSRDGGTEVFKDIPFAAPPVGPLRWRAPQPPAGWSGVRDATAYGPACMQRRVSMGNGPLGLVMLPDDDFAISEDCLNLNVRRPAGTSASAKLPVMMWIYGGAYQFGRNSQPSYAGAALVEHGVILVTPNYRLGALGFLAHPALAAEDPHGSAGDYGVLDVVAALRWVRANIARFGGDPANVTIFGQSAGGGMVDILAGSPIARGLFARSIVQSGGAFGPLDRGNGLGGGNSEQSLAASEADGVAWFRQAGVGTLADARALPADRVIDVTRPGAGRPMFFRPNVDGWLLPTSTWALLKAGAYDSRPALVGSTDDEGVLMSPRPVTVAQYKQMTLSSWAPDGDRVLAAFPAADDAQASRMARDLPRDATFAWTAWTQARLTRGGNVYLYRFDHRPPFRPDPALADVRAPHGAEIPYLFGNLDDARLAWGAGDQALSATVIGYWTNFAKTGDPNGAGLPRWPAFASTRQAMRFDQGAAMAPVPDLAQLEAIDAIYTSRRAAR